MGLFRREQHICQQVTSGEVQASIGAAAAEQQLSEVVAQGPMIDSIAASLAEVRHDNNFAGRFRMLFESGGD
jgi:hypothetical protein